jgi:hypothetical protein
MRIIRIEPETIIALIEQHILHVYGVAPVPGSVKVCGGLAYVDIQDEYLGPYDTREDAEAAL